MPEINRNFSIRRVRKRYRLSRILQPELDPKTGKTLRGFETELFSVNEDSERRSLIAQAFGRLIFLGQGAEEILPWLGPVSNPLQPFQGVLQALDHNEGAGRSRASLASSVGMRTIREEVLGRVLEFLEPFADGELTTFTLVNKRWRVTAEGLRALSPAAMGRQLRTHLNRAGVSALKGPLIAFIHGEYEPTSGCFQLHFHGITTRAKADRLRGLVCARGRLNRGWGYERTATGAAPLWRDPVRDRVRQVSYLLKGFWPQRTVRIAGGKPRRDRKSHRIGDPHHLLVLLWLDRHRWTDLALLQGCRVLPDGELRRC